MITHNEFLTTSLPFAPVGDQSNDDIKVLKKQNARTIMSLRNKAKKVSQDEYTIMLFVTKQLMNDYKFNQKELQLKLKNI